MPNTAPSGARSWAGAKADFPGESLSLKMSTDPPQSLRCLNQYPGTEEKEVAERGSEFSLQTKAHLISL